MGEDVVIEMERAQAIASQAEKRQRAFDKTIDEWKNRVTDLQQELDGSQSDLRTNVAEVYRLRNHLDESGEAIYALRRENKNLSDEIHDLTDQLGEGGRSVHEIEEAKVIRAQLEIAAIRQEIDRRIAEKDEEFEHTRKNHQRAMDSMQASLEAETRGRTEALRMKKKLEQDINELEVA